MTEMTIEEFAGHLRFRGNKRVQKKRRKRFILYAYRTGICRIVEGSARLVSDYSRKAIVRIRVQDRYLTLPDDPPQTLGQRLRLCRDFASHVNGQRITHAILSSATGFSQPVIARYHADQVETVNPDVVRLLARFYRVNEKWLLTGER